MKKTLTINLNGIVFNIDDDAYDMLNNYLAEISKHLDATDRDEVLRDIEARVAELFGERLQNRNVVEKADVEHIIEKLGQPNQYGDETETESTTTQSAPKATQSRKFYRDADDCLIGGVASGLATYMGLDSLLVRILFLLILLCSSGWGFLIYILLWIIVPKAETVAQKLEMQGIEPNVENIRNYDPKTNVSKNHGRAHEIIVTILRIILITILGCMGISLLCGVVGLLIAVFTVLVAGAVCVSNTGLIIALLLCIALLLLCPAIGFVMLCARLVSRKSSSHRWLWWTLLIVWLASLLGTIGLGIKAIQHENLNSLVNHVVTQAVGSNALFAETASPFAVSESRTVEPFTQIEVEQAISVVFTQSDSLSISITADGAEQRNITTHVENGELTIEGDHEHLVEVHISAPNITKIELDEASRFTCANDMQLNSLVVEADQASYANLKGVINHLQIEADAASHVDATEVNSTNIVAKAKNACTIALGTAQSATLRSNEASTITYKHVDNLVQTDADMSSNVQEE